jgi:hypothetical protein
MPQDIVEHAEQEEALQGMTYSVGTDSNIKVPEQIAVREQSDQETSIQRMLFSLLCASRKAVKPMSVRTVVTIFMLLV